MFISVTFMAKAKSARSAKCCQRSLSERVSFCKGSAAQACPPLARCPPTTVTPHLGAVAIGIGIGGHSRSGHVGTADGFDFGDAPELGFVQELSRGDKTLRHPGAMAGPSAPRWGRKGRSGQALHHPHGRLHPNSPHRSQR